MKHNQQKGQALIEVIVATSVFVGVILGLVTLVTAVFSVSRSGVNETQAASLAQEGFEAMRKIRDASWENLANLDENTDYYLVYDEETKNWSLETTPSTIDIFTRRVRVVNATRLDENNNGQIDYSDPIAPDGTLIDAETKKISITLNWKDKSNQDRSFTATSYLTNWH